MIFFWLTCCHWIFYHIFTNSHYLHSTLMVTTKEQNFKWALKCSFVSILLLFFGSFCYCRLACSQFLRYRVDKFCRELWEFFLKERNMMSNDSKRKQIIETKRDEKRYSRTSRENIKGNSSQIFLHFSFSLSFFVFILHSISKTIKRLHMVQMTFAVFCFSNAINFPWIFVIHLKLVPNHSKIVWSTQKMKIREGFELFFSCYLHCAQRKPSTLCHKNWNCFFLFFPVDNKSENFTQPFIYFIRIESLCEKSE